MLSKRCSVIALYDADGVFDEYVFYLIKELRTVSKRVIAVVNGEIKPMYHSELKKICDDIIIRPNCGYDGGAYRHIILNYLNTNELSQYDEIVFCNDTFFGPFIPFAKIFDKMQKADCDFWGMSYVDEWLENFIHSFFMVFRNSINKGDLTDYFNTYNNFSTYANVGYYFERKIFEYLTNRNYKYSTLMGKQIYSIFRESDKNIELGYPFMKKKAFIKRNFKYETIMSSLKQVYLNSDYDINLILSCIDRAYGINISLEEINEFHLVKNETQPMEKMITAKETLTFIKNVENLYIYGVEGSITKLIMDKLPLPNLRGFIVSEGYKTMEYYEGFPVYEINELEGESTTGILVALWYQNSLIVWESLKRFDNVLFLWDGLG